MVCRLQHDLNLVPYLEWTIASYGRVIAQLFICVATDQRHSAHFGQKLPAMEMRVSTHAILVNSGILSGLALSLVRGANPWVTLLVGVALLLLANGILIHQEKKKPGKDAP